MILTYEMRLLCLCLATFFLTHFVAGLAASCFSARLIRAANRFDARSAARLLFAFRLLPAVSAALVVVTLCAPSYLSFEQRGESESAGAVCLIAAALGATVWLASLVRAGLAFWRSARYLRNWRVTKTQLSLIGNEGPVRVVEGQTPFLAVAGVVRQRLVISRSIVDALAPDQLAAAIRHEREHYRSRDNLKRLLILLTPFSAPSFAGVDAAWARFTEWAADDRAASGDAAQPLALAEALIRVARLQGAHAGSPLLSSFAAGEVSARIERLLQPAQPVSSIPNAFSVAAVPLLAVLVLAARQPDALSTVHGLLEALMH